MVDPCGTPAPSHDAFGGEQCRLVGTALAAAKQSPVPPGRWPSAVVSESLERRWTAGETVISMRSGKIGRLRATSPGLLEC